MILMSLLLLVQPIENMATQASERTAINNDVPTLRLRSTDIKHIKVSSNETHDQIVIEIEFSELGNRRFLRIQEGRIGKKIALYVGDQLVSEPILYEYIYGGSVNISGGFSMTEALNLQQMLLDGDQSNQTVE